MMKAFRKFEYEHWDKSMKFMEFMHLKSQI